MIQNKFISSVVNFKLDLPNELLPIFQHIIKFPIEFLLQEA